MLGGNRSGARSEQTAVARQAGVYFEALTKPDMGRPSVSGFGGVWRLAPSAALVL